MKRITVLGSTGTIGQTTLQLIADHPDQFQAHILTAHSNVELLIAQALKHRPVRVVIEQEQHYTTLCEALAGTGIEVQCGRAALIDAAREKVHLVMAGIVGAAALEPVLAAIESGLRIGLANKECLVCAGDTLMQKVAAHGAVLLPVDSEHNAIFQAMSGQSMAAVEHITLTASGGPFRTLPLAKLSQVTPTQAVKHPNWQMGAKISVDSATMMNKGLELIEAHHLFAMPSARIEVLVHPESIIHGMVHFADGSVVAALSEPDMAVPIAHALAWPERLHTATKRLNLATLGALHFEAVQPERFPAIALTRAAMQAGGTAPCILNAANEVLVQAFLEGRIGFMEITSMVEKMLMALPAEPLESVPHALAIDSLARQQTLSMIAKNSAITAVSHGNCSATSA